jgi:hypothetical protein
MLVSIQYMMAATTSVSRFWKYWRPIFEARKKSSWVPTIPTSA